MGTSVAAGLLVLVRILDLKSKRCRMSAPLDVISSHRPNQAIPVFRELVIPTRKLQYF